MASLYRLRGETLKGITVDNEVPLEESNDAFDLRGSDNELIDCFVFDTRCRTSAHCDAVQIIPDGTDINSQYYGAIAYNNKIIGGGLDSNGSMQSIFASDGGHADIYIADQVIDTESEHFITLNGVLSGVFLNNKRKDGSPVPIRLEPMRIAGGLPNSFYVLSFKDHEYEEIVTDQEITDLRTTRNHKPNSRYVENFDLNLFREISESRADYYESIQQHFDDCMSEYESRTTMRLSPNFTLEEMTRSQTASRREIDNTPDLQEIENLKILCLLLEKIRAGQNGAVIVSSGFRSYTLNKAIGGASKSAHMDGLAADIKIVGKSSRETALWIRDNLKGEYDTNILEFGRWVHIAIAKESAEPRSRDLTAIKRDGRTVYLKGIK